MEPPLEFDHGYPTCTETYSTLRVFSAELSPEEISARLAIEPTRCFHKGDSFARGRGARKSHGWFFETRSLSDSRDSGYHLELILEKLAASEAALAELCGRGCAVDICSYWVGVGQGGPQLHPAQLRRLGALGLSLWWDIYFDEEKWLERVIDSVAAETTGETKRALLDRLVAKIRECRAARYESQTRQATPASECAGDDSSSELNHPTAS